MAEPSLYERLGGVFAIPAVIDHFSDAVVQNPIVGQGSKNPELHEWHTNPELDLAPRAEVYAHAVGLQRRRWTLHVFCHEAGKHPPGWRRPIATSTSPPRSSTRSRLSWDARSITSGSLA